MRALLSTTQKDLTNWHTYSSTLYLWQDLLLLLCLSTRTPRLQIDDKNSRLVEGAGAKEVARDRLHHVHVAVSAGWAVRQEPGDAQCHNRYPRSWRHFAL